MNKKIIILSVIFFLSFYSQSIDTTETYKSIYVSDLLSIRTDIKYTHIDDSVKLLCKSFSEVKDGAIDFVMYPKNFVLSIPDGQVYSRQGSIVIDGMYIDELIWGPTKRGVIFPLPDVSNLQHPQVIHGKVAVGFQAGAWNYYHWMVEVLPRLALLQKSSIDYDYLYLPLDYSFMKETVELLGLDVSQILQPRDTDFHIQADELIAPSMVYVQAHSSPFVIDFLRTTFIPLVQKNIDTHAFPKKIFISRRHAKRRKIANEDEVFALFQEYGFVRYNLEELSVLEQVALFHNAEFIVGEHGAGLTNIMFAQPGTQVVEIFQAKKRVMFWNLSQRLGLHHTCVKTIEYNTKQNDDLFSIVPIEPIKNVIKTLIE